MAADSHPLPASFGEFADPADPPETRVHGEHLYSPFVSRAEALERAQKFVDEEPIDIGHARALGYIEQWVRLLEPRPPARSTDAQAFAIAEQARAIAAERDALRTEVANLREIANSALDRANEMRAALVSVDRDIQRGVCGLLHIDGEPIQLRAIRSETIAKIDTAISNALDAWAGERARREEK